MTSTLNKKDYILFAVCACFCFVVFQHSDIRHTAGCSIAYLQGHVLDFYDWNAAEYKLWPSYMPSTYILFAIWNIPLKLLGIVTYPITEVPFGVLMYFKLLPTLFYFATAFVMYKIAVELEMGENKAKLCMYAFLTMPIGFYSQFMFGQYDSFTVFFVMLGIYYYLKDKHWLFVLFFAISMPFKYFSLLIFVPLLLLKEKNIWKIMRDIVLVAVPYAAEFLIYMPSSVFREYVLGFSATGYAYRASLPTGATELSLVICLFCLICAWVYFKNVAGKQLLAQWMCFLAALTCTVIFGLSKWHPQWLLFAVPFWVLGAFLHRETKAFWVLDVLMMLFFCIYLSNVYTNNADQALLKRGILGVSAFGKGVMQELGNRVAMKNIYPLTNRNMTGTILTSLMAVTAIFKYPPISQFNISSAIPKAKGALHTRFLLGISFFIVPALFCYLPSAIPPYLELDIPTGAGPVEMIENSYTQVFMADADDIVRIDFFQGTYERVNMAHLIVTLSDNETGEELCRQEYDTSRFRDNSWVSLKFEEGLLKEGRQYRIDFYCPDATEADHICLYKTTRLVNETTYGMENGQKQEYSLGIRLYAKTRKQR